jgi:DNA-binding NarL/FixJ family response regulator
VAREEKVDLGSYLALDALRIAVVDDSAYFRKIATTMLAAFGVRALLEASTEREAWKLIETARPDVLLVDWNLGTGGNGANLLDHIRTHTDPAVSTLAVALVTAYSTRRRALEAVELGANTLILKPLSPRILYERIANTVARRQIYERRDGRLVPVLKRLPSSDPDPGVRIRVPRIPVSFKSLR